MIDLFVFAALLLAFALSSRRLERIWVGAPLAFTFAGFVVVELRGSTFGLQPSVVHHLAEAVLVVLLFHDASQVRLADLRAEAGIVGRLLLIGLPLTIGAGYVLGSLLFPALGAGLLLFLAAALAPTDAGLGAATVANPVVPLRVRSVLNVESGLNDGLATPIVVTGLAVAAGHATDAGGFVFEIVVGVVVGTAVGVSGGKWMMAADKHGWTTKDGCAIAMVVLPFLAYLGATLLDANGFIAAFVAGLAFASVAASLAHREDTGTVIESVGDGLGAAVWYVFGAVIGPVVADIAGWEPVLFAVLSLTALRMVPVAVSLLGSGLRPQTAVFIGWFGPRGIASLVFALLSFEELAGEGAPPEGGHRETLATIGLTVLLSVFAHGLSGTPLADRYGRWFARERPAVEASGSPETDYSRGGSAPG